jgi:two-component system response regulator PilR (NtrC family)
MTEDHPMPANQKETPDNCQPIQVLVVDDEPILCEICSCLLADKGFHVQTATSFKDAMCIVNKSKIDVVVTDVQMPGGTGIDLLHEINKMEGWKPAVFLVSAFTKLSVQDSHQLGAVDLLDKPIDYDRLGERIVSEYYQRRELAAKGNLSGSSVQP